MAAIVSIVSRQGLRIEVCHTNQPNNSKPALYNPWLSYNSHLKQLCISNKMECISYKGGYGIHKHTYIEVFKRRVDLGNK